MRNLHEITVDPPGIAEFDARIWSRFEDMRAHLQPYQREYYDRFLNDTLVRPRETPPIRYMEPIPVTGWYPAVDPEPVFEVRHTDELMNRMARQVDILRRSRLTDVAIVVTEGEYRALQADREFWRYTAGARDPSFMGFPLHIRQR